MLYHRNVFELHRLTAGDDRLKGIRLRSDGQAEVTDGHSLIRYRPPEMSETEFPAVQGTSKPNGKVLEDFTLPAETAKGVLRALKAYGRQPLPVLEYARVDAAATEGNGSGLLAVTDLENPQTFRFQKVEGAWPKTDGVIPEKREDGSDPGVVTVDPAKLKVLCELILKTCGKRATMRIQLSPGPDTTQKPLRFDCEGDGGSAVALLMPVVPR